MIKSRKRKKPVLIVVLCIFLGTVKSILTTKTHQKALENKPNE